MAEELRNRGSKYKVLDQIDNLSLIKELVEMYNKVIIYGKLEIEPFVEFSIPFQAEYWYLKYSLLKNGTAILESNEQVALYEEKKLNIIWLSVTNGNGIIIECKDGDWFIIFSIENLNNETFLNQYELLELDR